MTRINLIIEDVVGGEFDGAVTYEIDPETPIVLELHEGVATAETYAALSGAEQLALELIGYASATYQVVKNTSNIRPYNPEEG